MTAPLPDLAGLERLVLPARRQMHALGDGVQASVTHLPALIAAVRERDAVIAAVRELVEHWAEVAEELGWARGAHFQDCADEVRANLPALAGIEQEEGKA